VLKLLKAIQTASKPAKQPAKKCPKVSEFVPQEKSAGGVWCTPEDAEKYILSYYRTLSASEESANRAIEAFRGLVARSYKELREIERGWDSDLEESRQHFASQSPDDEEDWTELRDELRDDERRHRKVIKWVRQEQEKLEADCRKPLRAVLKCAKESEQNRRNLTLEDVEAETQYKYPELPDRFYD